MTTITGIGSAMSPKEAQLKLIELRATSAEIGKKVNKVLVNFPNSIPGSQFPCDEIEPQMATINRLIEEIPGEYFEVAENYETAHSAFQSQIAFSRALAKHTSLQYYSNRFPKW